MKILIGLIQAIALLTLFISPIIWIWSGWSLAWRIGLSSFIVVLICKIVYEAIEVTLKQK